ncbi:MAG: FecR family protein [Aestuariivirgaceae bacterium]
MLTGRLPLSALFAALLVSPGLSAPAGKTEGISPVARVISGTATGDLSVGQDIFMGDTIATGGSGHVQIRFADRTRLVIGPESELLISKYVTSGSGGAKSFAVNAVTGAFRFISGVSAKPAYKITTPTATIGIRGTRFDFGVRAAGRTYVLMFDGVARLCGSAGSCRDLDELCELAGTNSRGEARLAQESDFLPRRGDLRRSFPYLSSQRSLNQDFRIATARNCRDVTSAAPGSDTGDGSGEGGDSGGSNR